MRINPGGRLDIKDVMGRDSEIARYWKVLSRQGLVISAERRIGKTHIVLKMRDECQCGYQPFYHDLEAVHSIADLIRLLYGTIHESSDPRLRRKARIAKLTTLLPGSIAGVDLPTAETTWQSLLSAAFDDLATIAGDKVVLMLWDEFPLMLHNLQQRQGHDTAKELLDFLRALRLARAGRLRFLFTGSIGLNVVLRSLRVAGNANEPVNDMLSLTVPPMECRHTCNLATTLLHETLAEPAQIPDLASRIAGEVGGFPYYVHHVVDRLDQLRRPPSLEDVSSAIENLVYDSQDPANFNYYLTRLSSYYPDDERLLALNVLDALARLSSPTSVPELVNLYKHRQPSLADEQVREVLTVLAEDHYLASTRCADGVAYDFRWPLVKKWWKETRA